MGRSQNEALGNGFNTTSSSRVRENSLKLSGYGGMGLSAWSSEFESRPDLVFLQCICSFVYLLRTLFVRGSII